MREPYWKCYVIMTTRPVLTPQQCDEFIRLGQSERNFKHAMDKVRKSNVSWIPFDKGKDIYKDIEDFMKETNMNFFGFDDMKVTEPGQYTEYSKGDYYNWHMDTLIQMIDKPLVRKISMTLLLSDPEDFEGGYLQVFGGDMSETEKTKIRIKRGYAVFFASFLLHRVTPIIKGNRKSLVMWFGGTPLK